MKNQLFKMALPGILALAVLTGCSDSPQQKEKEVAELEKKTAEARVELSESIADSTLEYEAYKEASAKRLEENEQEIKALRVQVKMEEAEMHQKHDHELDKLSAKNDELKRSIGDHKVEAKDKWEAFKLGFNKDLDEVGKSLSAMAEKNMQKK